MSGQLAAKVIPRPTLRGIVAVVCTLLLAMGGCGLVFRQIFDTSGVEQTAISLRGKSIDQIESRLGKPYRIAAKAEFNSVDRSKIRSSFSPKEIPEAAGAVWMYSEKLTLILLYEENGIVMTVYIGRT